MSPKFQVGDQVILTELPIFNRRVLGVTGYTIGKTYEVEAIRAPGGDRPDYHYDLIGCSHWISESCFQPGLTEEELDKQARILFGLEPNE